MKFFKRSCKNVCSPAHIEAFSRTLLLCWLTAFPLFALGSTGVPPITVCDYCQSDASFASAAEQAAPNGAPGNGNIVVYPMYVINPNSDQIRFYDVNVWYDWGDMNPHSAPDGTDGDEVSGASLTQGGLQKLAIQRPGDPVELQSINEGLQAVEEFAASLLGEIDSRDIPNAPDSAIDLAGPGIADMTRDTFEEGLTLAFDSTWGRIRFGLTEAGQRVGDRLLGSGGTINPNTTVRVNFPDGTYARVPVENVSTDIFGNVDVKFEVDQSRLLFSGGVRIPNEPEDLNTTFEEPAYFNSLLGLANRMGLNTSGFTPSSSCARMAFIFIDDVLMSVQCLRD